MESTGIAGNLRGDVCLFVSKVCFYGRRCITRVPAKLKLLLIGNRDERMVS